MMTMFRFNRALILPLFLSKGMTVTELAHKAGVAYQSAQRALDGEKVGANIIGKIANDNSGGNVPSLATKLGGKLLNFPAASDQLASLLTPENGQKALAEFLRTFRDGKLVALADAIGTPYMMNDVRSTFSGEISSGQSS